MGDWYRQVVFRIKRLQTMQRISCGLARAAAVRAGQRIDPADPRTWEFSGLSQNGEDGIAEFLVNQLRVSNRYFVEIGASDGTENNTSWFAVARRWQGVMVEGDAAKAAYGAFIMGGLNIGVRVLNRFVDPDSLDALCVEFGEMEPDYFSLDIDGIDYHVAQGLLARGFRPRIAVVEYNSCFGPERAVTIPYAPRFDYRAAHTSQLYYGASVAAWRKLWEGAGYRFVTVDRNGVNAFFAREDGIDAGVADAWRGEAFRENFFQRARHAGNWQAQYALIEHLPLEQV